MKTIHASCQCLIDYTHRQSCSINCSSLHSLLQLSAETAQHCMNKTQTRLSPALLVCLLNSICTFRNTGCALSWDRCFAHQPGERQDFLDIAKNRLHCVLGQVVCSHQPGERQAHKIFHVQNNQLHSVFAQVVCSHQSGERQAHKIFQIQNNRLHSVFAQVVCSPTWGESQAHLRG